MHDSTYRTRPPRSRRERQLGAAALVSAVLLAGCGGGSSSPPVAAVGSSTASTASAPSTRAATASQSSTATGVGVAGSSATRSGDPASQALAYSRCMRANGVPSFPDPQPGGGVLFQRGAGIDPSSPLFEAAQTKCQRLMPIGAGLAPGARTHPSQQALAQMLRVAQCMRRHGVSGFPEPRTSVPSNIPAALGGRGVISNIDGVILVVPGTIDEGSPLFARAAAACAFPLHNH